ncbi:hypothetical protein OAQ85_01275 [Schleiferiaceae bacterium]|nr:hypothetical protein [Flavobacteriales bacterium]MDC1022046.1 hypothetical protein [Schleiferiaceae bacterium]|tara:strand:- start:236 stop:463 length:228 start_codon:yes stop_codon:yes gene_type:complete
MEELKDTGDPASALAEKCAEVIQIINKMNRFAGNWNDVMPGQSKSSFLMLFDAMTDLKYQCKRLTKEIARGDTVE